MYARKAVKKTVKRFDKSPYVISIDDDESFGAGLVRLMSKRAGRTALLKHFAVETSVPDPKQYLAYKVYRTVFDELPKAWRPFDDFCDERGDQHFLCVEKFKGWLDATPINETNVEHLAALTSSFAMLQPEIRKPVYDYLVSKIQGIRTLLDVARHSDERTPTLSDSGKDSQRTEESPNRRAEDRTGMNAESLVSVLQRWELDTSTLTVARSSQLLVELDTIQREIQGERERYSSRLNAANEALNALTQLHEVSFSGSDLIPRFDDQSIDDSCEKLGELTSSIDAVSEGLSTRRELLKRLGRKWNEIDGVDSIASLRDVVETEIGSLRAEISNKAKQEEEIQWLLQEFLGHPVEDRPVFIEALSYNDVVQLGHSIFGPPLLGGSERLASRIRNDFALVGLLAGTLAASSPNDMVSFIQDALTACKGDASKVHQTLVFLSPEELLLVAVDRPERTIEIVELLLAAAIKANDHGRLVSLNQFVEISRNQTGPFWDLYEAFAVSAMQGGELDLQQTLRKKAVQKESPEKHLNALLADLRRRPSAAAGPLFHTLQEKARDRYILPLRATIESRQIEAALQQWGHYGDINDKVEACVAAMSERERRRVEARHRHSLEKYLDAFDSRLRACGRAFASSPNSGERLISELRKFRESHKDSQEPHSKRLMQIVSQEDDGFGPDNDFACRVSGGEISDAYAELIQPTSLNSWLAKSRGDSIGVNAIAADYLSSVLGESCSTVDEHCIQFFLDLEAFAAAKTAAMAKAELVEFVDRFLDGRKSDLLNNTIIDKSKSYRSKCPNIELLTEGFFTTLNAYEFGEAKEYLRALAEAIEEYEFLAEPENRRLYDFACELGIASPPKSRDAMEEIARKAKLEAGERRFHIEQLIACASALPQLLSDSWTEGAARLDSPKYWPKTEEVAFEIAGWIEFFADLLKRKASNSLDFAMHVSSWFLSELRRIPELTPEAHFDAFSKFKALGEREYWEESEVLKMIPVEEQPPEVDDSEVKESENSDSLPVPEVVEYDSSRQDLPTSDEVRSNDIRQLLTTLRREVAPYVSAEDAKEESDQDVSRYCAQEKWGAVRTAISKRVFKEKPENQLTDEECIYVIALAQTDNDKAALEFGLIGLVAEEVYGSKYYLKAANFQEIFNQLATRWIQVAEPSTNHDSALAEWIRNLPNGRRADRNRPAFEKMLRKTACIVSDQSGDRGDFALSRWLWDADKGGKKVADTRCDLLHFFYQIGRFDLLRHLADNHANSVRAPLLQCLEAFNQSESNEAALEEAQQLSHIVVEAAGSRYRPWKNLLSRLDRAPKEYVDDSPLTVEKESIQRVGNEIVLHFQLIPSRYDWPHYLQMHLGEEGGNRITKELLAGETLTRSKVVSATIPFEFASDEGDFLRIPFEIEGESEKTPNISLRGTWTSEESDRDPLRRLDLSLLQRYWPYADGKDVKTENAHHGREHHLAKIDNAIQAHDGFQKSLIIIGQRRIGKTSLLNQVVASYPPRSGACVAAFADISGFDKSADSLRGSLFDTIINQIEFAPGGKNKELFESLTDQGTKLSRIVRELKPKLSLSGALEGLSSAFEYATNGKIKRLAICLDEFHSVFAWRDAEEINSLMWDLRQIVLSSKRVSLLMAGSGLTRRLIEQYDQAFFGSIDTPIELTPFDATTESQAIADTFLPKELRQNVSPDEGQRKLLIAKACELTGGHPWYLAILGSSMASYFGITKITPAMLNHVAEELLLGNVRHGDKEIPPSYFYFHLFGSLDVLHEREGAITRLVLLEVARNTTFEYPWLRERRLFDAQVYGKACTRQEIRNAIKTLCTDSILEKETRAREPRYRIRIPLVASALKQDANKLESEVVDYIEEA